MLDTEDKNKIWELLPLDIKEKVAAEYKHAIDFGTAEEEWKLEDIFGKKNLRDVLDGDFHMVKIVPENTRLMRPAF